jgi:hypothetical protein
MRVSRCSLNSFADLAHAKSSKRGPDLGASLTRVPWEADLISANVFIIFGGQRQFQHGDRGVRTFVSCLYERVVCERN